MTPSNATAIEELESATDLSCSPQCTECRECLSDPKDGPWLYIEFREEIERLPRW